jgi:hypothetical protein
MNTNLHKNQYWSKNICARQLISLHTDVFFFVAYLVTVLMFRTLRNLS